MIDSFEIEARRRRNKNKPKGPAYTPPKVRERPLPKKLQPRWKWSYNGNTDNLTVWPTDQWGDPHHLEMTGSNYYQYCQGRLYVYGGPHEHTIGDDEEVEIMVWKDRGPEEWQPLAVEKVKQWVRDNFNQEVDKVIYRNEYAWYKNTTPATKTEDLDDYYHRLKSGEEDYLAEQYAQAVDLDDMDPADAYNLYSGTKHWIWMWDGEDFNARVTNSDSPTSQEYEEKFGDDGTWSAQGAVEVAGGKVTLIIDSRKPYAFVNDEIDLKKEQNDALDAGLKWIRTILGENVDHVKYASEPTIVRYI